ncbi:hypothetical protein E4T38_05541 [Aureobasidium subglaciale]|nr:hypothetical protein E4T38_05541 [Aureobasidium subglaciale]KAI5221336.1 hypothetical protein E4T40_05474 [Aureobasidium subglaciale]KAI5225246.1 hypothetical protein E4T41_05293 [Aureobasidium subglaciale]KAI5261320.1 hypothetical protein E4T46_05284 [Aureobasidium subglaciale]
MCLSGLSSLNRSCREQTLFGWTREPIKSTVDTRLSPIYYVDVKKETLAVKMTQDLSVDRPMEARTGRENQSEFDRTTDSLQRFVLTRSEGYGSQGERLVAGIVPLSKDRKNVLLIQSMRRGGWVIPKGGWEVDETVEQAACREAWEESGAICKIQADLGKIPEKRKPEQLTTQAPKAAYHFFEATVDEVKEEWPEKHKRKRRWMGYKEAIVLLKDRPELAEALNRSSIDKEL